MMALMERFMRFMTKKAMDTQAEGMVNRIVGIAIGILMVAILVPVALVTLAGANLSGVDTTVVTVLTIVLPILAVISIALWFLKE